ncbi:hypothetical protein BJ165DRAFT_1408088 [Panaeolus papilionaceus]|nr:hypothetical protein BJ165DRAFT_1408088 [Panaeolus papilionaceus]
MLKDQRRYDEAGKQGTLINLADSYAKNVEESWVTSSRVQAEVRQKDIEKRLVELRRMEEEAMRQVRGDRREVDEMGKSEEEQKCVQEEEEEHREEMWEEMWEEQLRQAAEAIKEEEDEAEIERCICRGYVINITSLITVNTS